MPNLITSGNVDTMLGAADNAAIRSAIGVGQTDAPTFLAQTLTGQSLTGTQATSLVDLATTWNTTGTPTALKLNVTETASNFSALLLDCQTGGTSRFRVTKNGAAVAQTTADNGGVFSAGSNGFKNIQFGGLTYNSNGMVAIRDPGLVVVRDLGGFCWENGTQNPATGTIELSLFKDAAGILAQRNGTAKQALRVYNTALSGAPEWAEFDWITSGGTNTLRIGTNLSGTGAARPIEFVTGGVVRMSIAAAGKIGIGTTTPVALLDICGANDAATGLKVGGTSANVGNFVTVHGSATNGGAVRIYSNYNTTEGALILGTFANLTNQLCLATTGSVGIGTTSPASKLTVTSGDVEVATIASGLILKSPDGTRYRVTVPNGGTVLTITAV